MKKIIPVTLAAAAAMLITLPSARGVAYNDRSVWESSVAAEFDVDETQWGTGYSLFAAGTAVNLPASTTTLSFNVDLYGAQVPDDWATWSGGQTPRVLYSGSGVSTVGGAFSAPTSSFGLEVQPNLFGQYLITLSLVGGSTLQQTVDGNAGAQFFGWTGEGVTSFTISSAGDPDGFAFGRMVRGEGAPSPGGVPDGGNLVWLSGFLWAGLLGLKQWRCLA